MSALPGGVWKQQLEVPLVFVNEKLKGEQPWKVVAGTAALSLSLAYLYSLTQGRVPLSARLKKFIFGIVKKIPKVREKIEVEKEKVRLNFETEFTSSHNGIPDIVNMPPSGLSRENVLVEVKKHLSLGDLDWAHGAMSGTVYNSSQEVTDLMTEVYGLGAWSNPLHPDAFPGLRKMEAEVVRMAADIFHGGPRACGVVTTGGTESIILACKAYRELARDKRGVELGEILVPVTAHAAFDKAADLLGMRLRHVPVDEVTKRVDIAAMKSMISRKTVMLVGSAPQFPHGSIDNIEAISMLGVRYNIPVHVDACLGGFLIAFMDQAGYPLQPFDFRLPGVTSISADTHKYGFAPKGSSVILYRDKEIRNYQWFAYPDWPGGIYATPTIGGSRAGGIVSACWAAIRFFGRDGYVKTTKEIIETTKTIATALNDIHGIRILGVPEVSVIAFDSPQFNIYGLSDGLKTRGWALNNLQFPQCVHICVTRTHTLPGVAERFISDVTEVVADLMKDPGSSEAGSAAMYGMTASIPDRSIVADMTNIYLDSLYFVPTVTESKQNGNCNGIVNGHAY